MECVLDDCAMETPSSNRGVSRSQAAAVEEKKSATSALLDITNDSPIVGLTAAAAGCQKTPASSSVKNIGFRAKRTPGSGEALLRGQVKTMLQRVEEEEAELVNKRRPFGEPRLSFPAILAGLVRSPAQLLAPTPTNTPQLPNSSFFLEQEGESKHVAAEVLEPKIKVVAAVVGREEAALAPQECLIHRALQFDSPRKSKALTWDDELSQEAEAGRGEEEVEVEVGGEEEDESEMFDDLCEGVKKMSVVDNQLRLPKFMGKHTRFVYNDDEDDDEMIIQREEEEEEEEAKCGDNHKSVSPSALLLKGLPAPEGKHLRFQDEDQF